METLDKVMIHILSKMETDGMRLCHATWNSTQLKACELFIPGISHLIFSDLGCPQGKIESEISDGGRGYSL